MKMRHCVSLVLLLCFVSLAHAQIKKASYYSNDFIHLFPDSVRLEFPKEQAIVVFEMKNYSEDHSAMDQFGPMMRELVSFIRQTSNESNFATTPHTARVTFRSAEEKQIEVMLAPATTKVTVVSNQLTGMLPPGWEIFITRPECKIYVYGKTLESIQSILATDLTLVTAKFNSEYKDPRRKSIKSRIIIKDGLIEHSETELKHPGDFIVGQPAFGFGFVENTFYPTLSFGFAVITRDRFGRKVRMVKMSWDYLLFTRTRLDGKLTVGPNLATSLSVGWNFTKNDKTAHWLAVGVGNVATRYGKNVNDTYFRGGTLRIFSSVDMSGNVSLQPELFLTDGYKNVIYGLRLNYRLP